MTKTYSPEIRYFYARDPNPSQPRVVALGRKIVRTETGNELHVTYSANHVPLTNTGVKPDVFKKSVAHKLIAERFQARDKVTVVPFTDADHPHDVLLRSIFKLEAPEFVKDLAYLQFHKHRSAARRKSETIRVKPASSGSQTLTRLGSGYVGWPSASQKVSLDPKILAKINNARYLSACALAASLILVIKEIFQ